MFKLFLDTTDSFLCNSIKGSFSIAEKKYQQKNIQIDLLDELKKFQENPLGCMIGLNSRFEAMIKIKIKLILGFFFVIIPLVGFSIFSYVINISLTYGFLMTFLVAILVASRMENISKRYTQARILELQIA